MKWHWWTQTDLKSGWLMNSTMMSFSGWIWSIFSMRHRNGAGFTFPPYTPPTYFSSIALSTSSSATKQTPLFKQYYLTQSDVSSCPCWQWTQLATSMTVLSRLDAVSKLSYSFVLCVLAVWTSYYTTWVSTKSFNLTDTSWWLTWVHSYHHLIWITLNMLARWQPG